MNRKLFISPVCDDCHFIEEQLKNCSVSVEVWDVKAYMRKPGDCRVTNRATGERDRLMIPKIPMLVESEEGQRSKVWVGVRHILERLGGGNRIVVAQSF